MSLLTAYITREAADIGWCSFGVNKRGWLLIETEKAGPLQSVIRFSRADMKFYPTAAVQQRKGTETFYCNLNKVIPLCTDSIYPLY